MKTNFYEGYGERKSISDWLKDSRCQVKYTTLYWRLKDGVPLEIALTPVKIERAIDCVGKIYNESIKVIEIIGKTKANKAIVKCQCLVDKCDQIFTCNLSHLKNGHTRSCGNHFYTHHLASHPLYFVWLQFNVRCYHKTCHAYKNYGERGIDVCEEWRKGAGKSFENKDALRNFIQWAEKKAKEQNITFEEICSKKTKGGKRPFYTLDRINNNKGYCPDNCRWATQKEQVSNRRKSIQNYQYDELNKKYQIILEENEILKEKLKEYEAQATF